MTETSRPEAGQEGRRLSRPAPNPATKSLSKDAGPHSRKLPRIALALGLGIVGAVTFSALRMPLPWMLGPICFCTAAALLRLPIAAPAAIRPFMVTVLGLMLGANFTPEMAAHAGQWLVSIAFLAVYVAAIAAAAIPYFRKVAGYDPVTAYFSAMPGGFGAMLVVAIEMGADERRVSLAHASRILLIVFTLPFLFRLVLGLDMPDRSTLWAAESPPLTAFDLVLLAGAGAIGWPLARHLRLPAPALIGPMALSAAAHMSGFTAVQVPLEIVNLAQLVIGVIVGCRFSGIDPVRVVQALLHGVALTAIMLAMTGAFAFLLGLATNGSIPGLVLAYSPGGLAEMTLIALALGIDVAFVATHHVVRILLISLGAPLVFRLLGWRARRR